jgi:hypothetical protein
MSVPSIDENCPNAAATHCFYSSAERLGFEDALFGKLDHQLCDSSEARLKACASRALLALIMRKSSVFSLNYRVLLRIIFTSRSLSRFHAYL